MRVKSKRLEGLRDKIKKASTRLVYNEVGNVDIHQTLDNQGVNAQSYFNKRKLLMLLPKDAIKAPKNETKLMFTGCAGLKIGEKTLESHTTGELKLPAIFEIVHLNSGRRLISSSNRPDKQRSVMFFWMKNWFKYSNANPFFGNVQFAKDFTQDGPQGFEYRVIESFEFIEPLKLKLMAKDFILTQENTYNRPAKGAPDLFYGINKEMRDAVNDLEKYKTNLQKLKDKLAAGNLSTVKEQDLKRSIREMKHCVALRKSKVSTLHRNLCQIYDCISKPFSLKGL
jgi:hypothetical protein